MGNFLVGFGCAPHRAMLWCWGFGFGLVLTLTLTLAFLACFTKGAAGVGSSYMRETFFERFGSWLALGLTVLFAWRLISLNLQESEAFPLLFPLHWIALTPAASFVDGIFAPFKEATWWLWAEVGITVLVWTFLYFVARAMFHMVLSMEGLSIWVAFALCILLAGVFFFIVVQPAFQQMEIWRLAWPQGTPSLP